MIKKSKLYVIFIFILLSILVGFPNKSMARVDLVDPAGGGGGVPQEPSGSDPITNPNAYKPGSINTNDANIIASKAGIIFNAISTLGIIIAVITIIVIGIKYMIGSVEEKAEYKKTMIPYLIGVVMIGSISAIVRLIANLVANIE